MFSGCPADAAAQAEQAEDECDLPGQVPLITTSFVPDGAVNEHIGLAIPAGEDVSGTGSGGPPAILAFPASAAGCRAQKVGIGGLEIAKSGRSFCRVCHALIGKHEYRFLFWHARNRPPGYIHKECIVGVPLPPDQLLSDLKFLAETGVEPKQVISDAWAVLHTC